jgi:hypothetical protein
MIGRQLVSENGEIPYDRLRWERHVGCVRPRLKWYHESRMLQSCFLIEAFRSTVIKILLLNRAITCTDYGE